jgi:GNAT superfamily N-acetyltransferase
VTPSEQIELTEPQDDEDWEQYNTLRYEVLRKPHGQPRGSESDHPLEPISTHVLAKLGGRVVGGGCWVMLTRPDGNGGRCKYARFRQIAVDPEYRKHGIATKITDLIEASAREQGAVEIVGTTRNELIEYYRRKGWHTTGPGPTLFGSVEHTHICKPFR